jgi:hypothetical protein
VALSGQSTEAAAEVMKQAFLALADSVRARK